jgi:hypothetical protein
MTSRLLRTVVPSLLALAASASAQQPTTPPAPPPPPTPALGDVAPDFSIRGATRYGLLSQRVHLSDFKGQTVVLAFFYQARTRG